MKRYLNVHDGQFFRIKTKFLYLKTADDDPDKSFNFGGCFEEYKVLIDKYFRPNIIISAPFSYFYLTKSSVFLSMDACSRENCNNASKIAQRVQSKCQQDKPVPEKLVYSFSASIYDQKVDECYFCQNCSLSNNGAIKECKSNSNVCEVETRNEFLENFHFN